MSYVTIALLLGGVLCTAGQTTLGLLENVCDAEYIPEMPMSCSTCAERCGGLTEFAGRRFCACDPRCLAYGDCCPDFQAECPEEFKEGATYREQFWGYTCRAVPILHYILINVCRKSGRICPDTSAENVTHSNLAVPVIDLDTGLHYTNTECALCNDVTRIQPWTVLIKCVDEINETDISDEASLKEAFLTKYCAVYYPNDNQDFPRRTRCALPNVITECPSNCSNEAIRKLCNSPTQTTTTSTAISDQYTYKNYYCALCNEPFSPLYCSDYLTNEMSWPGDVLVRPFSLELIFDFDPSRGLSVGQRKKSTVCPEDQIFVLSEGSCRQIACPDDQRLLNGSCLSNQANMTIVVTVDFNRTWDAEVFEHFMNTSTSSVRFLATLYRDLQQVLTAQSSEQALKDLSLLHVMFESPLRGNVTLLLQVEFSPNSTAAISWLRKYKHNSTAIVNTNFISLLQDLNIDIKLVEITIEGTLTFERPPVRDCTWVVYSQGDYEIINSTLRLVRTDQVYDPDNFRVIAEGSTLVCVAVSEDRGLNLDVTPALGILTLICISLSIVCLLVRIILHFVLPYFRSFAGHMQFNLCVALCLAFILLIVGGALASFPTQKVACHVVGALMYWAFLSAFFWMVAMAFDSFLVFRPSARFQRADGTRRTLIKYIIAAWVVPAILMAVVVSLDFTRIHSRFRPNFGENICWFNERYALLVYFGIPVTLTTLATLILFVLIVVYLGKTFNDTTNVSKNGETHRMFIYARLFALMGICWVIGFVAAFVGHIALWIIFILLNASQGIFIFFSFVFRKVVLTQVREMSETTKSSTASTSVHLNTLSKAHNSQT